MIGKLVRFICFLAESIIVLFTTLIPRNKKMIIFGAWWGNKYDDNSRALFEYTVKNRPDIQAYWLSSNKNVVNSIIKKGYPAIYSKSIKAIYIALRTGYECYCTSQVDVGSNLTKYLGGCTIINLWHGVPLKKILYDDSITNKKTKIIASLKIKLSKITNPNWFVICTSDFYYKIYQHAFRISGDKVLNLGQARNDYLFYDLSNPYKEKYAGKTIIVYMPTHRQEGRRTLNIANVLDLYSLDVLLKKSNAILLIKKHYYHREEPSLREEFENIQEVTDDNPEAYVLLKAADILISDYSSVYIDYLLLKRPQLFFCFDYDDYIMNDREMYIDYFSNVPGPICKNSEELLMELKEVLSGVDRYQARRQQQLDFFYSPENQSIVAPKQLDVILNI